MNTSSTPIKHIEGIAGCGLMFLSAVCLAAVLLSFLFGIGFGTTIYENPTSTDQFLLGIFLLGIPLVGILAAIIAALAGVVFFILWLVKKPQAGAGNLPKPASDS